MTSAARAELREIKVTAAVSPTFKFDPSWDRDIRDRILYVNKVFEPVFGIHFTVDDFVSWEPIDERRETDLMMEELRSFIPLEKDQVVIGFHKMTEPFSKEQVLDLDTVGSAQFFRGFIVVRDPFGPVSTTQKNIVMLHEFAHLFGAVHVKDPNAIMSPRVPGNPSPMLDPENKKIISSTKNVDFTVGLDSLTGEVIDQLIRVYEKLIRQNPHSDFYYQLGKFYVNREQEVRAVSIWEEAVRINHDNPHIHRELGFYYYKVGRYADAIQKLSSSIAYYLLPSQKKAKANVLSFLGVAYYQRGNLQQAIVTWLRALTEDPDDYATQGNLAVAYLQSGDVDRAINELTKLAAKKPNDVTILSNLGAAMMQSGRTELAIDYLSQALQVKNQAKAQNSQVEKKDALSELLGETPREMILVNLGFALMQSGQFSEAGETFRRALKINPKNYDIYRGLAEAYIRTGNYEAGLEQALFAKKLRHDDPYLYTLLSQAYLNMGGVENATGVIRDGLRYAEGNLAGFLHKQLGVIYAQKRRFSEALEEFRVAINQNWNDTEAHFFQGNVYAIQGEKEKARRSYGAALRIDPKHAEAKKALASL